MMKRIVWSVSKFILRVESVDSFLNVLIVCMTYIEMILE